MKIMKNEDSPAFPVPASSEYFSGISKREYFAAMALQGMLAVDIHANFDIDQLTDISIEHADLMLSKLSRDHDECEDGAAIKGEKEAWEDIL